MKRNNQETTSREYTSSERQALLSIAGISALAVLFSTAVVLYSSQTEQKDVAAVLSDDTVPLVEVQPPAL